MTSRTPQQTYDLALARLLGEVPDEDRRDGTTYGDDLADEDRSLIETFIRAHDPADPTVASAGEKSYNTLARYIANLIRVADRAPTGLAGVDADALNQVCADLVDEGRSEATVRQTQMTLRSFYGYHDDLGADPDRINTFSRPSSTFDDRDMLTRDEIEAIEAVLDHPRDLAIFHLLLHTGQRVGSLRTLRVKDVDPNEGASGRWHFNADADGLKDVYKPRAPRPLFGAQSAVRDWLKYHPTGEPDHYLFTGKPRYNEVDPTEPVTAELFRRMLAKAKEKAGVEKPMHTHMMRHNAVTIWKRDYDVPDETVKFYLGHSPSSTIMETTYSHLSAEDHSRRGEEAMGYTDDDAEGEAAEGQDRLGRESCDVCGHSLKAGDRICGRCGTALTPDAERGIEEYANLIETMDGDQVVRIKMASGEEIGVLVEPAESAGSAEVAESADD